MDQSFETKSLLPWLDSGSPKIHLDISVQKNSSGDHTPFLLLNTPSPLFRLVHASYQTPSRKTVKDIFLLVQNDHCSFFEKNSHFNNPEIDKIWQDALASDSSAITAGFFDSLAEHGTDETSFLLWQSLFYCTERKCYFHPPCPECGNFLKLCHQDDILSAAGLPPYSSTLERFLFCPVCHGSQSETNFFSHGRKSDFSAKTKGLQDLIVGFGQLVRNNGQNTNFPCSTCSKQKECYGLQASARIRPFAFYPFRMLITDAGQLPAEDFLAIVSGASWAEIKHLPPVVSPQQRIADKEGIKLFFDGDARSFVEIFFLKIALLEQITRTALAAGKNLQHVDLRLSMDQFWVNFPDYTGLLPYFWNFQVRPIALGIFPPEDTSFVRVPNSIGLHSLAFIWLNALLVNKKQSTAEVQHALAHLLGDNNQQDEADFLSQTTNERTVFHPKNIFWIPEERQIDQSWLALWDKALRLGWSLLQSSFHPAQFSEDLILDEITSLAGELKTMLFAAQHEPERQGEPVAATNEDDAAILQILRAIQKKWQDEVSAAKEEAVEKEPEPVKEEIEVAAEQTEYLPPEEELEKTVILSAEQLAVMMGQEDQPDQDTMSAETSEQTAADDSGDEMELDKTVIMNVNDLASLLPENNVPAAVPEQSPLPEPQSAAPEQLSETVIINLEELEKLKKLKNGNK